ncbi:MAG: phenylalanine--tRNA ligase subunit beta [Myxococcales bacterium]|nr:phenylalanine--tRNA ligase subunit beta [Myxococcales bacterium]
MRISLRWLCELLPALDREPSELADLLSGIGLAVDGVERLGEALAPLRLASVQRIAPHPARSNLQLVTVSTGDAEHTVVCGAKNVPEQGLVVLAGLGTKLPGVPFTLTARDIGGVVSEGMLCSESELGLADSSDGILTFPVDAFAPGTPFVEAFPEANDTIFEIDVTPNRPDALGHLGVARDLAALLGMPLKPPGPGAPPQDKSTTLDALVRVTNHAPERCPHYAAGAVRGLSVKPSPDWMRWRLHRLGVRPISNVVDVTNWLLLEFGQPMHAFDLKKVRGARIDVRMATPGERLRTLDGEERELDADDLLICDGEGPTALAGVMGGADSEIQDDTTDVLLECAYFVPQGVRRTARRHGMHTESSHRFERGTDFGAIDLVLQRAQLLLCELAGGRVVPGSVHLKGAEQPPASIELRASRLAQLLGVNVPFKQATRTLQRLGFDIEFLQETSDGGVARVRGASWRPDVQLEVDLIEEIARMRGLDNVPTVLPAIRPQRPRTSGKLERQVTETATQLGLSEAVTYAFVSRRELAAVHAPEPVVVLDNPLSEERSVLRTSLLPGLLEALRRARRRGERNVRLFSVGARFLRPNPGAPTSDARPRQPEDGEALPEERLSFAAVLAGARIEHLSLKAPEVDVYDAKGIATELVERLTRQGTRVVGVGTTAHTQHLHPRGAAELFVGETRVGRFGPLHPDVVDALDLDGSAQVIELDLVALEQLGQRIPRYRPIPKLPAIVRDLSLVVSEQVPAAEVGQAIREAAGSLCESVQLAAEFRGGSVPEGHRSLTYRVVYRDPKAAEQAEEARTLTDKEVDQLQQQVLRSTQERVGATLRG